MEICQRRVKVAALIAISLLGSIIAPGNAYVRPGGWVGQIDLLANGTQPPDGHSCRGQAISGNGRFVAFVSNSDGYVADDTNLACDIFVRDLKTGKIERVNVSSAGAQALGPPEIEAGSASATLARNPAISASGRYVAFVSNAVNLVANDTNLAEDIFVHDRDEGTTERVSIASDGSQAEITGASVRQLGSTGAGAPSITDDGRYIAFTNPAQNLDPSKTYGSDGYYVFVRDRRQKTTELISVASDQSTAVVGQAPSISADGRYVSFSSPGDFGVEQSFLDTDIFVHDRKTHETALASSDSAGVEGVGAGNLDELFIAGASTDLDSADKISANGRYVVFAATYSNLVPNDSDRYRGQSGLRDVFVKDLITGRTERISVTWTGEETTRLADHEVSVSDDGRYVAYTSWRSDVDDVDVEGGADYVSGDPDESRKDTAYIYDRYTGAVVIAARDGNGRIASDNCYSDRDDGGGGVTQPRLSKGARMVLFSACSHNLRTTEAGSEPRWHYFVRSMGEALGAAPSTGVGPHRPAEAEDGICLASGACIPPFGALNATDRFEDELPIDGADLISVSLAYRPQYEDLFGVIELEHMSPVLPGVISPIFYGVRFRVDDESYEVRATSLNSGTFGLFDCTGSRPACTQIADLRGGYGTTGMRAVFSLPLEEIGLKNGGKLRNVSAFSGIGNYLSGAAEVLDSVGLR